MDTRSSAPSPPAWRARSCSTKYSWIARLDVRAISMSVRPSFRTPFTQWRNSTPWAGGTPNRWLINPIGHQLGELRGAVHGAATGEIVQELLDDLLHHGAQLLHPPRVERREQGPAQRRVQRWVERQRP